jgi:hypothetical protein
LHPDGLAALALIIADIQVAARGRFLGHSLTAPQARPLVITVWIVFGLATLQLRGAFTQPGSHAGSGVTVLYYGATVLFTAAWLDGAAAVWLLWRPASRAFFKPQGFTQALSRQF